MAAVEAARGCTAQGTEEQWSALVAAALAAERLPDALRCAAACGDIARVKYINKVGGWVRRAEGGGVSL